MDARAAPGAASLPPKADTDSRLHDDETKVPRKIGKYEIYDTLGKGGYSWVKRGVDTETGATVALKFMARATDEWAVEQADQVRTEIKSLTQIRHPNVMKLYAYNLSAKYPTADGKEVIKTILLVLEYCPGGEIFDILYYAETIDKACARTYLHQMIDGLDACHRAGVAHRDIKPQNLLLDGDFQLKITDFGLSKVIESDADSLMRTTYVGTRGYQAPELLNNKMYTNACDIFSMGVVVFIMLCGYPPFERAHKSDRWYRPLYKGDVEAFWKGHRGCGIPEECKTLIEGMLCYKPAHRITIDEIKSHPFWDNGPVLDKATLKKRILLKYEEARKKRAKDAAKMKDLAKSLSNRDIPGYVVPETPILEEGLRPRWHYFYADINTPAYKTNWLLRDMLAKEFDVGVVPDAWEENPFEFRMTCKQQVRDRGACNAKTGKPADEMNQTHMIDHVVDVKIRRDPVNQRNMVIFSLVQTGSKIEWVRIWRKMFAEFHAHGIADNMLDAADTLALRGRPSVPRDERGDVIMVAPRILSEALTSVEEDSKEESPETEAVASAAVAACGVGAMLCGGTKIRAMVDEDS